MNAKELNVALLALADKAVWAAAAGSMTELMPDDVRLLREAAHALSADRGEAVAWRVPVEYQEVACDLPYLLGRASLEGHEVGQRLAREVQAKLRAALATQPSPAESAECHCPQHGSWIAADDVKRLTRTIDVAINGEAGAAKQASLCDVTAQIVRMFTDAAPSQVSDALQRILDFDGDPRTPVHTITRLRGIARAALEAAQPQPGRVEGMVLVPVDEIERAVKVMRYAAHPHTSPNADALAKFIAPRPTAGGTRNAHDLAKSGAMVDRVCKCCGAKFTARAADVKRGWARFCSKSCKATQQSYPSDRDLSDIDDDQSWGEHELWDARP